MLSFAELLCRTTFRYADVRCASQCHAELRSAAAQSYAILSRAMLCYTELHYVELRCATLCYAVLRSATLSYAVLLRSATQSDAVLHRATLSYAVLRYAINAVLCRLR